MKICLIVDDTPVIRKVARRIVELLGYVVIEAEDGEHALAMCFDNRPDVILVDWDMPKLSGIDFISAYRAMEKNSTEERRQLTKIIYSTSELMVVEMTKAKRAGADGFLMKPYNRHVVEQRFTELNLINSQFIAA